MNIAIIDVCLCVFLRVLCVCLSAAKFKKNDSKVFKLGIGNDVDILEVI